MAAIDRLSPVILLGAIGCLTLAACQVLLGLNDRKLAEDASTTDSAAGETGPGPDGAVPDQTASDQTAPDQAAADEAAPDAPSEEAAPAPGCVTNAQCTAWATEAGPWVPEAGEAGDEGDAGPMDGTVSDAGPFTGEIEGGVIPAVCVQSVGKCARLLSQDCTSFYGDYLNDNAILIGTMLNVTGSLAAGNIPRQQSVVLAASELNSSQAGGGLPSPDGGPSRPLLILECDPGATPGPNGSINAVRAASHLANDLHVPAVVGPNLSEDVLYVTQHVSASAGMLLMATVSTVDPITYLNDNGLTWRDIPTDTQREPLYADQLSAIANLLISQGRGPTLKLGILQRSDALGNSALAVLDSINFNNAPISAQIGHGSVDLEPYALSDIAAQAAIATKYATQFQPDIVFVVAQEGVSNIVFPLEQQWTAADAGPNRPYYLITDVAMTSAWYGYPTKPGIPADLRSRVRGVGFISDTAAVPLFNNFQGAFSSYYKEAYPNTSGMGPTYDALYSIAYAIVANNVTPVTGTSVAQGLNRLYYGPSAAVGGTNAAAAIQELQAKMDVTLEGTYTLMHWDNHGDLQGGTLGVMCLGSDSSGKLTFAPSGRTMDVATGIPTGTYTQCP
jgi:ABC-type branched-subunit amino acid transport system substrate-binding protein